MGDRIPDELEDLLDAERRALLAGELDVITRLGTRKERLLQRLGAEPCGAARMQRIAVLARRNGELLATAADGVRAAVDRLRALASPPPALTTYGIDGRRQDLGGPTGGVTRRA